MTGLVLDVPVVAELLQRDQNVIAKVGRRARDITEHGQEEWIDLSVLSLGLIEQQQGDRIALVCPQAGGIAINEVVQFAGDLLDSLASLRAHQR